MREEARPQPSPRAVARLEEGLDLELGGLRARLHRALAEADEHQAAGRDDLAAAALEAERTTLAEVHRRLEVRLAAASVEREAEAVLAAVDTGAERPAAGATPDAVTPDPVIAVADVQDMDDVAAADRHLPEPTVAGSPPLAEAPLVRLVASAVAAVVGIVLLAGPDLVTGGVTAAGEGSGPADVSQTATSDRSAPAAEVDVDTETAESVPAQVDAGSAAVEDSPTDVVTSDGGDAVDRDVDDPTPQPRDPLEEALDLPVPTVDLVDELDLDRSDRGDEHDDPVTGQLGERAGEDPRGTDRG